jgi:hypothetical protein
MHHAEHGAGSGKKTFPLSRGSFFKKFFFKRNNSTFRGLHFRPDPYWFVVFPPGKLKSYGTSQ